MGENESKGNVFKERRKVIKKYIKVESMYLGNRIKNKNINYIYLCIKLFRLS